MTPSAHPGFSRRCFRHRHLRAVPTPPDHLVERIGALPVEEDRRSIQESTQSYLRLSPASRLLFLESILSVSCIPQLSFLSRSLPPLLRIDIVAAVPVEISLRILSHLDALSLCRAARVNKRWRALADDDFLWKRLCAQHIDRKCHKCGWGLPMLSRKKPPAVMPPPTPLPPSLPSPPPPALHVTTPSIQPAVDPTTETATEDFSDSENEDGRERGHEHEHEHEVDFDTSDPASGPAFPIVDEIPEYTYEHDAGAHAVSSSLSDPPHSHAHTHPREVSDGEKGEREEQPSKRPRISPPLVPSCVPSAACSPVSSPSLAPVQDASSSLTIANATHTTTSTTTTTTATTTAIANAETLTNDPFKERALIHAPIPPPPGRRSWKEIFAERLVVERGWRKGSPRMYSMRAHVEGVMCLQATDDLLISGSYDGTVRVWSWEEERCLRVLRGHRGCVRALQFDGAKLVTAGMDRTVRVWDWRTGKCLRILEGSADAVATVAFEGRVIVSGGADAVVRVWDATSGECWALRGHGDWVNCVEVWRGRWVFSGSDDGTVRMWDLATRRVKRIFRGHSGQVQSLALAPPAHQGATAGSGAWPRLITGALDNTVRIWDVESGLEERTLFGHVEGVWCVAADRLRIVSGSNDRTVKVWDIETGACIRTLEGHRRPVNCVGVGGSWVASGGDDCEVRVWDFGRAGALSHE